VKLLLINNSSFTEFLIASWLGWQIASTVL
jgi:hypothetical protein